MVIFWCSVVIMTCIALAILLIPLLCKSQITRNIRTAVILLLTLPTLAITLYLLLGASHNVADYQKAQQQTAFVDAQIQKMGSIQNIIEQLKATVTAHPDSRGWLLLGRLYLKTDQYKAALDAFTRANQLTPDQPDILTGYAQALYLDQHMKLIPPAKYAAERALQLQPQQPDALNLLAVAAYQQGEYAQAIGYWERLLAFIQPNTDEANQLLAMIASAQKHQQASQKSLTQRRLTVQVNLTPTAQSQVQSDQTVFIYAQAINGPPIPLAVVRRKVSDLPAEVALDETMAMVPTATLADYDAVRIIARISISGQPIPGVGDWEGRSGVIKLPYSSGKIFVTINQKRAN